ncbi:hypothetical protein B5F77_08605 [Parabacteroides sp. An277]|nr:hypothetical protein B5F77_08605 [Parabacteroides sp. An277]
MSRVLGTISWSHFIIFAIYIFLSIYEMWISAIIGPVSRFYIIIYLCYLLVKMRSLKVDVIFASMLAWIVYSFVSTIWSQDIEEASISIYTMALMALLTLLLGQYQLSSKQIIRILDFYLLVSASLVILGLFFSRPITEDNETRNVVYLFGLAPDPNNLLTLYSVCFSISIYYALFLKRMRIINYVLTLLSVYVIFNTGSRSGIIILLFLTSILFWYGQKDKPLHSKVKITIVAILILFVIYLLLPVFLSDSVYDRIMGKGELAFMDSTGREVRWSTALNEWLNSNILFGLGLGSAPAHSTFITMLVALGIIGYTFFLIFIFGTVIKIIRQGNVLALLLFVSPMLQSFFIDAQNKRFFWNGIIFPYLLYNCIDKTFVLKDHSLN